MLLAEKSRAKVLEMAGVKDELDLGGVYMTYHSYLVGVEGIADGNAVERLEDEPVKAARTCWTADDYPELARYLSHEEKNLKLAQEAAGREKWWSPYVGDSMIDVMLPALGAAREVGKIWCARATLRAGSGDFAGFLEDVTAARRLARHVGGGATLIERLVGVAMEALACQTIGAVAGSGKLSAEQCDKLAKAMGEFSALPTTRESVDVFERWEQLDCVQLGALGKSPSPELKDLWGPMTGIDREAVDWDVVLKRINKEMDAQVATMKAPTIQELHEKAKMEEKRIENIRLANLDDAAQLKSLAKEKDETLEAYANRVAERFIAVVLPSAWEGG